MASGLGTPLASGYSAPGVASTWYPGLTALTCWLYGSYSGTNAYITRISPSAGPLKAGNTLTITGNGFLPIAGADEAKVGSTLVPASCSSASRCTITMPRRGAGTVRIQVYVEAGLEVTPVTSQARYDYAAAARISSLSPRGGPAHGGTRVTIRGSNFVGTVTVHFGSRTARISVALGDEARRRRATRLGNGDREGVRRGRHKFGELGQQVPVLAATGISSRRPRH